MGSTAGGHEGGSGEADAGAEFAESTSPRGGGSGGRIQAVDDVEVAQDGHMSTLGAWQLRVTRDDPCPVEEAYRPSGLGRSQSLDELDELPSPEPERLSVR